MKSFKHIALGAFVTFGVCSSVIYTSCSKNESGAVTCLNDGVAKGGICKCVTGTDGVNCQIVYRNIYAASYKGIPPDDPISDTTNSIFLVPTDDTDNYNKMELIWVDTTGTVKVQLPLELNNNSAAGSNFKIPETTKSGFLYTGTGSVNGKEMSMSLKAIDAGGGVHVSYFHNYIKQ